MKKILSAAAISALMFTADPGLAGNMKIMPPSLGMDCPADCQDQIDQLNSSQARQDEQLGALEDSQARQDQAIEANTADIQTNLQEIEKLKTREEYKSLVCQGHGPDDLDGFNGSGQGVLRIQGRYRYRIRIRHLSGTQFGNLRLEGELGGRTSDIKDEGLSDVTISTAMLNGFYGVPVYGPFSVYGTAGAGTAKVEMAFADGVDDSEVTFAYKAGAGVAMDIARNMALDLGYEYLRTGDVEFGRDHDLLRVDDLKSSAVNASVRYSF
ncbi:Opacity protein [Candidatus Electrothrix marina]|uniref:Opacity protein n=1 Tax=Candidatus Electrothrix marina TaxID=1859130 RepID=A0A444JFB9_9BACT|nr:Opacity protein [Candidatus Electrothrix marina]